MRKFIIDGKTVTQDSDCYVIAEIGHNHQGRIETCKEMFRAAKECGASAVKLQKRDNKKLYTKAYFDRPYDSENSFGSTYGLHREALEFGRDQYIELKDYAKELGITFFSTAFDIPSADFLEDLDMPAYKIASGDLKSIPLLKHIASFQKPMVISTGGGTMEDVIRAYEALRPIHTNFCFLQCTAGYPAAFDELNLRVIQSYAERFPEIIVGLSSHDNGIAMGPAAYVLGARVIEKHFTLNRAWKGTDHAFSLEPSGLKKLVRDLKRTRQALGDGIKQTYPSEVAPMVKMGKKLVAARDLAAGTVLRREDITMKSPADGIEPFKFEYLIGKTLSQNLREDDAFSESFLK